MENPNTCSLGNAVDQVMHKKTLTFIKKSANLPPSIRYQKSQHLPKRDRPHKERISKQCTLAINLSVWDEKLPTLKKLTVDVVCMATSFKKTLAARTQKSTNTSTSANNFFTLRY